MKNKIPDWINTVRIIFKDDPYFYSSPAIIPYWNKMKKS